MKNHVFRHSVLKRVEGSLSYGKNESASLFLKVWSNIVRRINAIGEFLVGKSFVWKTTRARDFVHVVRSTPRNTANERMFLHKCGTANLTVF